MENKNNINIDNKLIFEKSEFKFPLNIIQEINDPILKSILNFKEVLKKHYIKETDAGYKSKLHLQ